MQTQNPPQLSRREREILDIVYRLGKATATEIHAGLAEPPTPTTVRGLLRVLEGKGHLWHTEEGKRFVYVPCMPRADAGRSLLKHVVKTFFAGSPSEAVAALVGSDRDHLTEAELARLTEIVNRAASARRARRKQER